jgi:hypothetical protein
LILGVSQYAGASLVCRQSLGSQEDKFQELTESLNILILESQKRNVDLEVAQLIQSRIQPSIIRASQELARHSEVSATLLQNQKANVANRMVERFGADLAELIKHSNGEVGLLAKLKWAIGNSVSKQRTTIENRIKESTLDLQAIRAQIESENYLISNLDSTLRTHLEAVETETQVLMQIRPIIEGLVENSQAAKGSVRSIKSFIISEIDNELKKLSQIETIAKGLVAAIASSLERNLKVYSKINTALNFDLFSVATMTGNLKLLQNVTESSAGHQVNQAQGMGKEVEPNSQKTNATKISLKDSETKNDIARFSKIIFMSTDDHFVEGALHHISQFDVNELPEIYVQIAENKKLHKFLPFILKTESGIKRTKSMEAFNQLLVRKWISTIQNDKVAIKAMKEYFTAHGVTEEIQSIFFNEIYRDIKISEELRLAVLDVLVQKPKYEFMDQLKASVPAEYSSVFVNEVLNRIESLEVKMPNSQEYSVWHQKINDLKDVLNNVGRHSKSAENLRKLESLGDDMFKAMHNVKYVRDFRQIYYNWLSEFRNTTHEKRGEVLLKLAEACLRQPKICGRDEAIWVNFYSDIADLMYTESSKFVTSEDVLRWSAFKVKKDSNGLPLDKISRVMRFHLLMTAAQAGIPELRVQIDKLLLKENTDAEILYYMLTRVVLDHKIGPDASSEAFEKLFMQRLQFAREKYLNFWKKVDINSRESGMADPKHSEAAIEYRTFFNLLLKEKLLLNQDYLEFIFLNFGTKIWISDFDTIKFHLQNVDFNKLSETILAHKLDYWNMENLYLFLVRAQIYSGVDAKETFKKVEDKFKFAVDNNNVRLTGVSEGYLEASKNRLLEIKTQLGLE